MKRAIGAALALVLGGCLADEPLQQPTPLFDTAPFEFPAHLWDEGVEGETVLMIHITRLGAVDSAYVWRTSGHAPFDSAALAGATALRFTPGRRGERRVDLWAKLPVRFSRDGASAGGISVPPPGNRPDDPEPPAHSVPGDDARPDPMVRP